MRAFLVIGLGRFGRHLALGLMKIDGNEVMVLDRTEELVSEIAPMVTKAQIGDGTKIDVLRSIGINTFDALSVWEPAFRAVWKQRRFLRIWEHARS